MMNTEAKNYLGIDWGASDVGIAFADAETRMAFPVSTLSNDKTLLERLRNLIMEREVGTVVIGIPSYINRTEVEYEGERIGKVIRGLFKVCVAYQNEMFTTKMAEANLKERGIRHIARFDDAEAARIILQEWLDRGGDTKCSN